MLKSKRSRLTLMVASLVLFFAAAFVEPVIGFAAVIMLAFGGLLFVITFAYDWCLQGDEQLTANQERQRRERGLPRPTQNCDGDPGRW